jgi:hypothetical protein
MRIATVDNYAKLERALLQGRVHFGAEFFIPATAEPPLELELQRSPAQRTCKLVLHATAQWAPPNCNQLVTVVDTVVFVGVILHAMDS